MKKRGIEQGGNVFEAILTGGIRVVPQQPLEMLVSRVPVARSMHLSQEPFWAYTAGLVDRICGPDGVRLRGGDMIPWGALTHPSGLVVVRLMPYKQDTKPIVALHSLLRLGTR